MPRDYATALSWFRKAADAGNALGMTHLGSMYEKGRGVEQDYQEAVNWSRKAASLGDEYAINRLHELGEEP